MAEHSSSTVSFGILNPGTKDIVEVVEFTA